MEDMVKKIVASAGSAVLIAGSVTGAAVADGVIADGGTGATATATVSDAQEAGTVVSSSLVQLPEVLGKFSFTQSEVSSNDWIARHIAEGSKYLCAADNKVAIADVAAEDWTLSITGDVSNPYEASIGELACTQQVQMTLMACNCAGNPADGLAMANAMVKGFSLATLIEMASPVEGANTVVITSADGYSIALPLSYLQTHYCPLVFNVNGSDLVDSVGGTVQLWLGSTPASYFTRDVVNVSIEARDADDVPASPNSDEARSELQNLPNLGILFGGEIR